MSAGRGSTTTCSTTKSKLKGHAISVRPYLSHGKGEISEPVTTSIETVGKNCKEVDCHRELSRKTIRNCYECLQKKLSKEFIFY